MRNIKHMFLIIIAALFLGGCPAPMGFVVIEAALGETIEVQGNRLSKILKAKYTLSEVIEDTRCAAGEVCTEKESFVVRIKRKTSFLKSAEKIDLVFSDKIQGEYVSREGYCAALVGVEPLVRGQGPTDYADYTFKIFIGARDHLCSDHLVWQDETRGILSHAGRSKQSQR